MRNGDSALICSFYWLAWFWGRNDPTSLAGTPTLGPKTESFFSISITKRGCEREGDITISTYFNIHFTPCILYIYYLPILVQVPLTYISHHGGFKIFQASQLIARHWPGILPTPWIWGPSIPLQRFSLRGAPSTAPKKWKRWFRDDETRIFELICLNFSHKTVRNTTEIRAVQLP